MEEEAAGKDCWWNYNESLIKITWNGWGGRQRGFWCVSNKTLIETVLEKEQEQESARDELGEFPIIFKME